MRFWRKNKTCTYPEFQTTKLKSNASPDDRCNVTILVNNQRQIDNTESTAKFNLQAVFIWQDAD
jgi:hypothetical protein